MRYNLGELEDLFREINSLLQYVEENKITYRNYFLFLANLPGDENLKFQITRESIPHLLGIDTNYLNATGLYTNKNAYQLTIEMLEDPYKLYNLAKNGIINYDKLFSIHINKKLKAFKNNINMNAHEITGIVKYYADRTYMLTDTSEKFEYVIIKEYTDGNIGLLCLAKNNEGVYVPMSSRLLETEKEKEENLEKILRNQEITCINSINLVGNREFKSFLTFDDKKDRIQKLRQYKLKYNTSIDTNNDSLYYLNMLKNNRTVFAQSEEASTIIEQSKELERIRKEIAELQHQRSLLQQQNTILISENNSLVEQVEIYKGKEEQIIKILRPES